MNNPADRLRNLPLNFFSTLSERVALLQSQGKRVIRLDEGSPDLPPASFIVERLVAAARRSNSHSYQPHRGPSALRNAWAEMYDRLYGVKLDATKEIVPLIGSKEGIFHLLLALVNPGQVVLIPDPGYMTYSRGTLLAGGEPYYIPLLPENNYLPDLTALPADILRRARMLWLNYPNNPTAAIAPMKFFEQAVEFGRRHGILICHDAAYAQVTFDGYRAPSILQVSGAKEVALEFNTLSKSHNMAGWRVAAAVGNATVNRLLFSLKTNADSSHFLPVLEAATAAMTGDQGWLVERNQVYQTRRDLVFKRLQSLGFQVEAPKASLYFWFPTPKRLSSETFTMDLLEQALVSLTPGTVFGRNGEGYVRLSITAPFEDIEEAMERLADWMERR